MTGLTADFSSAVVITFLGIPTEDISNVTVTYGVSGIGTSGVCTRQLSFDMPTAAADNFGARMAEVRVYIKDSSGNLDDINMPPMYIRQRSRTRNTVHFECVDATAFLDERIDYLSHLPAAQLTAYKKRGYVYLGEMLDYMVHKSALADKIKSFGLPGIIIGNTVPLQWVQDTTYLDLLTKVSQANLGYWSLYPDTALTFTAYNSPNATAALIEDYTAPDIGYPFEPKGLLGVDSDGAYHSRGSKNAYDTFVVESELMTSEYATVLYEQRVVKAPTVLGTTNDDKKVNIVLQPHSSLRVERCVLPQADIPSYPSFAVLFRESVTSGYAPVYAKGFWCTNATYYIKAGGIQASLSGNDPSPDEIGSRGVLSRAIEAKIDYGKHGKVVFDKYNGISVTIPNEDETSSVQDEEASGEWTYDKAQGKYVWTAKQPQ